MKIADLMLLIYQRRLEVPRFFRIVSGYRPWPNIDRILTAALGFNFRRKSTIQAYDDT